jgi:4-hydroxy-3-polyprenylbenzoate decarboxylase
VFDEVPGIQRGFRLLLNMFAGTRRNMTLGFPDYLSKWELSEAYREAYLADPKSCRTRSWKTVPSSTMC